MINTTFGQLNYGDQFYYTDDDVPRLLLKIDVPRLFGRRIPMAVYLNGGFAHYVDDDQVVGREDLPSV